MATVNVDFYKNFSKRQNSTKQPLESSAKDSFSCYIKDNCRVTEPVIEIVLTGSTPLSPVNPAKLGYNYAYISDFSRYYFVNDWNYYKGTWTASLTVDVLASFKTQIGDLSKYINRCAYEFDGTISDSLYPTKDVASINYVYGENPFKLSVYGSYIVGIIGESQLNTPNVGGVNYYLFTHAQMRELINYLLSSTFANIMSDSTAGLTESVVKAMVNPLDYIESCIWFPFDIIGLTNATKIQPKIGWWNNLTIITEGGGLTPLGGGFITSMHLIPDLTGWNNSIALTDHPQISRGAYLNNDPYSNYVFHLDPWGDILLDSQILTNHRTIDISIYAEGLSGMGVLELYADGIQLTRKTVQLGITISIAQVITDFTSMADASSFLVSGAVGLNKGGGLKAIGSFLKNQFGFGHESNSAIKKGLEGIGNDIMSGVLAYNSKMNTTGVSGSYVSFIGKAFALPDNKTGYSQGPWIKIVRFELVSEDNTDHGRPLSAIRTVKNIPGYMECADGEHDISAFDYEKNMISSYLTGGFFYE